MTTRDDTRGRVGVRASPIAPGQAPTSTVPPERVDCLIVHQFDAARHSPGGIDTCVRGIVRYAPAGMTLAIVGVDAGGDVPGRRLGTWERHEFGGRAVWFLPVVRLDPGNQSRVVPHSIRLMTGVARYLSRLPRANVVQAHRADTALAVRAILGAPLAYFIHTQEAGLTSATSDSVWRFASRAHATIERSVVASADGVVVFNPDYARKVRQHNARAIFSPTWFDPALLRFAAEPVQPYRVVWVGRLEEPKDPALALAVFAKLADRGDGLPWTLELVGAGTLASDLATRVEALPADIAARIQLRGRLTPTEVADVVADSGVFLMTSHPGYEGFPLVLVEALAAGVPAVVTRGSDTGSMIRKAMNGLVCDRDPGHLAAAIATAVTFDRRDVRRSALSYGAPELVRRIFDATSPTGQ